ncbi:MAG TPA: preprotein translocase subunit YajC [Myxococcota bacterium]|jgi:preprotein translocase subunit YajC|nr:preprotein translocase subunit YajC [Myxococcota bacterium]
MSPLPALILLQAASGGGPDMGFFLMIGSLFLIMYLFVLRPQQRRQKEQEELVKGVGKGDVVVTAGGLHGKIVGTTDDVLTLEIDAVKGVRVKVDRRSVERRTEKAKEGAEK